MDQCLTEVLEARGAGFPSGDASGVTPQNPQDDCRPGAVVVSSAHGKAEAGVMVRIEQQCWDPVLRRRRKTVLVRFADGDRHISAYIHPAEGRHTSEDECLPVSLRASEAARIADLLQGCAGDRTGRETGWKRMERKAS
jgi:hypothetical protein